MLICVGFFVAFAVSSGSAVRQMLIELTYWSDNLNVRNFYQIFTVHHGSGWVILFCLLITGSIARSADIFGDFEVFAPQG